jgi:hypothetical protein
MRGAHEHHVWRWQARRTLIDREIERLERELAAAADDDDRAAPLRQALDEQRRHRQALGPSPRPKMG